LLKRGGGGLVGVVLVRCIIRKKDNERTTPIPYGDGGGGGGGRAQ